MSRSSVVLPQPLGPSSTTVSPSATVSEARSTATTPPKPMTTASISSFAIDPGPMRRAAPMAASSKALQDLSRRGGRAPLSTHAGSSRLLQSYRTQVHRAHADRLTLLDFRTARQQLALVG